MMPTHADLIARWKAAPGSRPSGQDPVHAALTAHPGRLRPLRQAVESLWRQVDTLHVFLDGFEAIPDFLDRENIFLTRSQDFGDLGECGKYYWTDDLTGYHLICSDQLVYPGHYAETMKARIEDYGRKSVIGAGGYRLNDPFVSFSESATTLPETENLPDDIAIPLVNDLALAYHSSTLRVSRHYFYQPAFSALWFSILALEQKVPLICCRHKAGWLARTGSPVPGQQPESDTSQARDFLVRSYFAPSPSPAKGQAPADANSFFDKIYVINLDRRADRWEKIEIIAKKHNLNVTRFAAVDGNEEPARSAWESYSRSGLSRLPEGIVPLTGFRDKFLKYHHYVARLHFMETKLGKKAVQSPGAWGYALSYIAILKEAVLGDYRRILILDDDVILHKSFAAEFARHVQSLPGDWKLILLGAMQHRWEPDIPMDGEMFYHCHGSSVASHAVGIEQKAFLPLLFYANKLDLPIDEGAIFHMQNVYAGQCYVFLPNLAIQDMTESDIGSSVMRPEEVARWTALFHWNLDDYDFTASNLLIPQESGRPPSPTKPAKP